MCASSRMKAVDTVAGTDLDVRIFFFFFTFTWTTQDAPARETLMWCSNREL